MSGRSWVAAILLIAAALIVYGAGLDGPFIYDDFEAIVENESIRDLGEPLWVLRPPDETPMAGRPLANLSMAVSHAISGLDPRGFRRFNLGLHILVGLLIFRLLFDTLRSPRLVARLGDAALPTALGTALLWLVHPLHSEVVLYVTQRTESLAALFYLVTMSAAIRAWDDSVRWRWSLLAVVACACGLATKETVVSAPVAVMLWDWCFRSEAPRRLWQRRRGLYAALAACWLVTVGLLSAGPRAESVGFSLSIGPWNYLLHQCELIPHYLRLTLWPHPLILDYGFPGPISVAEAAPGALLLAGLAAVTLFGLARRLPAAFLGAWFFVLLAPSSSLVPIATEVGAERRVYLASLALIALPVVAGALWAGRAGARRRAAERPRAGRGIWAAALAVGAVTGLLAGLTATRAGDYSSRVRIWETVVEGRPQNYRGHNNLGLALADEGRTDAAELSFRAAIELREDYPDAQSNLCNALRARGDLLQAMIHCRRALELDPDLAEAHNNLGAALAETGAVEEAIVHFRQALEIDPGYEVAERNLALALTIGDSAARGPGS